MKIRLLASGMIAVGVLVLPASLSGCCIGCVKASCADPCSEACLKAHREASLGAEGLMRAMYNCPPAVPVKE